MYRGARRIQSVRKRQISARSGAEAAAAAAKDNINLKYSNDPVAANQATLIQNAVEYFGSDENLAGNAVGERITTGGREAPAQRDPGAGLGGPGRSLCRCAGQGARNREPAGQR